MKNRINRLILAVIICLAPGIAGSGLSSMGTAVSGQDVTVSGQEAGAGAYLWKASIGPSTFYLAGSIHLGNEKSYPLPDAYLDAYHKAGRVLMELKEDFETLEEMIFEYGKQSLLAEEQYLDKQLDEETLRQLEKIYAGKEEQLERFYRHEGWMLNMSIAGRRCILAGYDPELAVDKYFHDMATKDGKEILGLDSLETQLKLFEFHAPLSTQVRVIEAAVAGAQAQAEADTHLFEAYYTHDPATFEKAFLAIYDFDNPQVKKMYDMLFVARNKAWVKKIKELAFEQPGTWFMLVGCGHYFGPGNVRELLEAEGFHVEP